MRRASVLAASVFLFAWMGAQAPARASHAEGYHRAVDIWVLSFWLHHTYAYYSGYGWECYGGSCSGGRRRYSSSRSRAASTPACGTRGTSPTR